MRKVLIVLTAMAVLALPAGSAFAASDPTASQYGSDPKEAASSAQSPSGVDDRVGGLPVTGTDLIAISAVALVLTGTGFVLRMLSAPRRQ